MEPVFAIRCPIRYVSRSHVRCFGDAADYLAPEIDEPSIRASDKL